MKNKNYLLIVCMLIGFSAFKASAQTASPGVDPVIKQKYESWSAVPGDKSNTISVSLKLDPAIDGSTMCKLNLKNSGTTCKHVKLAFTYSNNNNNVFSKTLDVYVKPNGVTAPYLSTAKGMDYFYFNAAKISQTFTATVVEDSDMCK
jgi:hypothetical protein